MLLVAPGLATRNKRPLEPTASPLIENEEAGMRKKKQGGNDRSSYVAQRSYGRLVEAFRDA